MPPASLAPGGGQRAPHARANVAPRALAAGPPPPSPSGTRRGWLRSRPAAAAPAADAPPSADKTGPAPRGGLLDGARTAAGGLLQSVLRRGGGVEALDPTQVAEEVSFGG